MVTCWHPLQPSCCRPSCPFFSAVCTGPKVSQPGSWLPLGHTPLCVTTTAYHTLSNCEQGEVRNQDPLWVAQEEDCLHVCSVPGTALGTFVCYLIHTSHSNATRYSPSSTVAFFLSSRIRFVHGGKAPTNTGPLRLPNS